jgi:hypothetical protein
VEKLWSRQASGRSPRRAVVWGSIAAAIAVGVAALSAHTTRAAGAGQPPIPTPIGRGPLYHPTPTGRAAARGAPVGRLRCTTTRRPRFGAHVELFANRRVLIVPAGIGIAPPLTRVGAYVRGGRCSYPLRTREPTGVIEAARGARFTLGDFFRVWDRALSARRLVGFRAKQGDRVRAYVDGRRWRGDVRSIPLVRHAQIVVEVGGYVRPHRRYLFRRGL